MPRRNFRYLYKDEIIPSATELRGISELYDLYTVKAAGKSYPTGFYITGSSLDSGVASVSAALTCTIDLVGYFIERTFITNVIFGTATSSDINDFSPRSTTLAPTSTGISNGQTLLSICDVNSGAIVGNDFIVTIETAEEGILYQKTITII